MLLNARASTTRRPQLCVSSAGVSKEGWKTVRCVKHTLPCMTNSIRVIPTKKTVNSVLGATASITGSRILVSGHRTCHKIGLSPPDRLPVPICALRTDARLFFSRAPPDTRHSVPPIHVNGHSVGRIYVGHRVAMKVCGGLRRVDINAASTDFTRRTPRSSSFPRVFGVRGIVSLLASASHLSAVQYENVVLEARAICSIGRNSLRARGGSGQAHMGRHQVPLHLRRFVYN